MAILNSYVRHYQITRGYMPWWDSLTTNRPHSSKVTKLPIPIMTLSPDLSIFICRSHVSNVWPALRAICRCLTREWWFQWLVVYLSPCKILVNWDDDSQLNGKIIQMFQSPPTSEEFHHHLGHDFPIKTNDSRVREKSEVVISCLDGCHCYILSKINK